MADQSQTLSIIVKAKDFASGVMKNIGKNASGIGKNLGSGLSTAIGNVEKLGFVAAGAAAGGLAAGVKMASDFEAQLNTINTVAHLTPAQLAGVGDGIRQIARDTGASTSDLTSAYYDLVSAGVSVADAQKVLTTANTLAIGGLATTGQTVDLLTSALNAYGLKASDATMVSNDFAQAIAAGKVTAADIAESFAGVGSTAAAAGIGIDEVAAAYAQLTSKGVPASEVATQMRAAIITLQKPTSGLAKAQKDLNVNFADVAKEKGLAVAYGMIADYAKKTNTPLIQLLGNVEANGYALNVTGDNAAGYAKNLADIQKSSDGAGVASEQAAERQKGFSFQLGKLKAIAKDAAITFGTALLPTLTDLATKAADFLGKPDTQSKIKQFAQDVATDVQKIVGFLKDMDWKSIGSSLQTAAGFGKDLMGAFMGAPDWLKTAVIGGWGLNKITGGAAGSIFGSLASGLIKGVLGMTAGVVNAKAGVVNVSGGIGGAAGGKGGAGVGGFLNSKVGTGLSVAGAALSIVELKNTYDDVNAAIKEQSAQVMSDIPKVATQSFTDALTNTKGLTVGLNTQASDLFTSFLMKTGSGVKESVASFTAFADDLMAKAETPADRAAAQTAIHDLYGAITTQTDALSYPEYAKTLNDKLSSIDGWVAHPPAVSLSPSTTSAMQGWLTSANGREDRTPAPTATPLTPSDLNAGMNTLAGGFASSIAGLKPDLQLLASKFDTNNNGVVTLKEVVASRLDMSVGELRAMKNESGGWNSTLASKLGISNSELQSILTDAGATVSQLSQTKTAVGGVTSAINRKDLSVKVTVNVSTTTKLSNRTIASDNYRTVRNAGVTVN